MNKSALLLLSITLLNTFQLSKATSVLLIIPGVGGTFFWGRKLEWGETEKGWFPFGGFEPEGTFDKVINLSWRKPTIQDEWTGVEGVDKTFFEGALEKYRDPNSRHLVLQQTFDYLVKQHGEDLHISIISYSDGCAQITNYLYWMKVGGTFHDKLISGLFFVAPHFSVVHFQSPLDGKDQIKNARITLNTKIPMVAVQVLGDPDYSKMYKATGVKLETIATNHVFSLHSAESCLALVHFVNVWMNEVSAKILADTAAVTASNAMGIGMGSTARSSHGQTEALALTPSVSQNTASTVRIITHPDGTIIREVVRNTPEEAAGGGMGMGYMMSSTTLRDSPPQSPPKSPELHDLTPADVAPISLADTAAAAAAAGGMGVMGNAPEEAGTHDVEVDAATATAALVKKILQEENDAKLAEMLSQQWY